MVFALAGDSTMTRSPDASFLAMGSGIRAANESRSSGSTVHPSTGRGAFPYGEGFFNKANPPFANRMQVALLNRRAPLQTRTPGKYGPLRRSANNARTFDINTRH